MPMLAADTVRIMMLACLWRSALGFVAAPSHLATGRSPVAKLTCRARLHTSTLRTVAKLRDDFGPGISVAKRATARNLAEYGAAIVFVPEERANLTVASNARYVVWSYLCAFGCSFVRRLRVLIHNCKQAERQGNSG